MTRERKEIDWMLANILDGHIYGHPNSIPREYFTTIKSRGGNNVMIILDLNDQEQVRFYRLIREYIAREVEK